MTGIWFVPILDQPMDLLLDAKSAFNKVARESAVRNAYLSSTTNQALIFTNLRLENKNTYI